MRIHVLAAGLALSTGCERGEPPGSASRHIAPLESSRGRMAEVSPNVAAPSPTGTPPAPIASTAAASGSTVTFAASREGTEGGAGFPPLAGSDAGTDDGKLPQTRDRPDTTNDVFQARVRALSAAILRDDPSLGMPFFFPLGAYEQVKDVQNPAADWKRRLVAAYERDVHELHEKLGSGAQQARLESLVVPEKRARWVEPGEEYNRIGYWRVFGSKLVYRIGDTSRELEVRSMISWRGQWYVVHLGRIR